MCRPRIAPVPEQVRASAPSERQWRPAKFRGREEDGEICDAESLQDHGNISGGSRLASRSFPAPGQPIPVRRTPRSRQRAPRPTHAAGFR
jgi:hypothetical protein